MVSENEISVLLFHRISDHSDQLWPSMTISVFEKIMDKLKESVQIISFQEMAQLNEYPKKPLVIISFDDGYTDFFDNVMPILISKKIKANHNICPGLIESSTPPWTQILSLYLSYKNSNHHNFNKEFAIPDHEIISEKKFIEVCKKLLQYKDEDRSVLVKTLYDYIPKEKIYTLMDWQQIKYCSLNNIEFGSHGNFHRNLLQVSEPEILFDEIDESKRKIEAKLGTAPIIFAFANAMGNDASREYVKKSFYRFILITMDKMMKWKIMKNDEKIEIPRINISRNDWREEYLRALGFHYRIKNLFKIV